MPIVLPTPPNPAQSPSQTAFNQAMFAWGNRVKQAVEQAVNQIGAPAGQQFLATDFTTNTVASGTATGTDVANALASLVQTLTAKGILSPTTTRGQ